MHGDIVKIILNNAHEIIQGLIPKQIKSNRAPGQWVHPLLGPPDQILLYSTWRRPLTLESDLLDFFLSFFFFFFFFVFWGLAPTAYGNSQARGWDLLDFESWLGQLMIVQHCASDLTSLILIFIICIGDIIIHLPQRDIRINIILLYYITCM